MINAGSFGAQLGQFAQREGARQHRLAGRIRGGESVFDAFRDLYGGGGGGGESRMRSATPPPSTVERAPAAAPAGGADANKTIAEFLERLLGSFRGRGHEVPMAGANIYQAAPAMGGPAIDRERPDRAAMIAGAGASGFRSAAPEPYYIRGLGTRQAALSSFMGGLE